MNTYPPQPISGSTIHRQRSGGLDSWPRRLRDLWHQCRSVCISGSILCFVTVSTHAADNVTIQNQTYASGQVQTVAATSTISANTNVVVSSNATITYVAGTRVTLGPGFTASTGAALRIYVGDSDGDGMPDGWEIAMFGSLAQTATGNYDGDGFDNITEFLLGTNSLTATPATAPASAVVIRRPLP